MNRFETKKILASIDMIYSNFQVENSELMADTWHRFLQKYEYADISAALEEYVENANSAYAPNVSQLIGIVKKRKTIPVKLSFLNSAEAWSLVRIALQNSTYNSENEFNHLPKMVQRAVGSANQLQAWATDDEYNEGVISSNFKRAYEAVCNAELKYMELTEKQKQGLEKLEDRLMNGEDLREIIAARTASKPEKAIETSSRDILSTKE